MKNLNLVFTAVLLSVFFFSVGAAFAQSRVGGRVVEIIDGKTVIVESYSGDRLTAELQYIEVPASGQPLYETAKAHLQNLVLDQKVEFKARGLMKSRTIGQLFLKGVDVSQQMIRDGAAWHSLPEKNSQDVRESQIYEINEEQARSERRGIWAIENLKPSWQLRAEAEAEANRQKEAKLALEKAALEKAVLEKLALEKAMLEKAAAKTAVAEQKPRVEEKRPVEEKPRVEQKPIAEQKPRVEQKTSVAQKPRVERKTSAKQNLRAEQKPLAEQKPRVEQKTIAEQKPSQPKSEQPKPAVKPQLNSESKLWAASTAADENIKLPANMKTVGGLMVGYESALKVGVVATPLMRMEFADAKGKQPVGVQVAYLYYDGNENKGRQNVYLFCIDSESKDFKFLKLNELVVTADNQKIVVGKAKRIARQTDSGVKEGLLYEVKKDVFARIAAAKKIKLQVGAYSRELGGETQMLLNNLLQASL